MRVFRENLLVQFSVLSFVVMVAIGLALALFLSDRIRQDAIDDVVDEAIWASGKRLISHITPEDLETPMTGERYRKFDAFVRDTVASDRTARVKLWSADGTVIYSDDRSIVGQVFRDNERLLLALNGQPSAEIEQAASGTELTEYAGETDLGTVIEVYVPITFSAGSSPQGAFEIYQYYAPVAQRIDRLWAWVFGSIGVGFMVLFASLVSVVWRGWNTIKSQKAALVQANDDLFKANQRTEERLALILASAGEGICGLDADGNTTFINPAAAGMLGWDADELIGKPHHLVVAKNGDLNPTSNGSRDVRALAQFVNGDIRTGDDMAFVRSDDTSFPVEYTSAPIRERGELIGTVVVFRDITERRRSELELKAFAQRLEKSNGELQQFASVAAHDLQEPLRKVRAFGDRLKSKCADDLNDRGRDYVDRMQDAASRMQVLIDALLTYSRVTTKAKPFTPTDLNDIAHGVIGDLEIRIEESGGRVELGKLPTVDADPTQMRQLLQNLVGNALKFHRPDEPPVVRVTSTVLNGNGHAALAQLYDGELCQITVRDNGIGFDAKYADRIFGIFQRLHGRGEYEGTGIGLSLCRKIAERHGGAIIAESEPGQGSTFTITLPLNHNEGTENNGNAD